MAVVQLRNPTEGRTNFDAKKAGGKTSMEAMRALKRRLSNVVFARMLADQNRREATGPRGPPPEVPTTASTEFDDDEFASMPDPF